MKKVQNFLLFIFFFGCSINTFGKGIFLANYNLLYGIYNVNACDVPTGLTSTNITSNSVTLGCNVVAGALKYVFSNKLNGGVWVNDTSLTNSTNITGLSSNSGYQYKVKVICSSGTSAYSGNASYNTLPSNCDIPSNPNTTGITSNSAVLNWTAVGGANAYTVEWRQKNTNGTWPAWTTVNPNPTVNNYTLTGLTTNKDHQWHVKSICSSGESDFTTPNSTFTTSSSCGVATNLSATNLTTTSAVLNWAAGNGAISYNVDYKKVGDPTWITSNTTALTTTLINLIPNTNYHFRICTVCANNVTTCSTTPYTTFQTQSLTCDAPTGNSTTNITLTGAKLNWTAVTGVLGYKVRYRQKQTNGQWPTTWVEPNTLISVLFYDVSGLVADRDQQWQVKSVCTGNVESTWSTPINNYATLGCVVPIGLLTTDITVNAAKLNWTAVAGSLGYKVRYRAKNANGTWPSWTEDPNTITAVFYNLSGLAVNTDHQWQVKTICTSILESAWSTTTAFTTGSVNCDAPINMSTSNTTQVSATFNWSSVNGASSYQVEYRMKQSNGSWGVWSPTPAASVTGTSYNATGLTPNQDYQWHVKTICSNGGESGYTTPNTSFSTTGPCAAPTGISAISNATDAFTISWDLAANAIEYSIRYKLSTSNDWTNFGTVISPSNSYIATGLTAGATYDYQVSTVCGPNDTSAFSGTGSVTVNTPCNVTAPTYLDEINVTANEATLLWSQVFEANNYFYQYRLTNDPNWNNALTGTSPTNSANIANLQANTNYTWRVKSLCAGGLESDYSTIGDFKTNSTCNYPNNIVVSNISTTSATLTWLPINSALKYLLQISTDPNTWPSTFISITHPTVSYLANGLILNTTYYYRMKTVCEGNDTSTLFSPVASFTTTSYNCEAPTTLSTTNISSTQASMKWLKKPNPPTVAYYVCFKKVSDNTWNCDTIQNTNGNGGVVIELDSFERQGLGPNPPIEYVTVKATSLMPNTDYVWKVKSICANGSESAFTTPLMQFTTDGLCKIPTGLGINNITATSTTLKWNIPQGSDVSLFKIQYRIVGATSWTTRFVPSIKDTVRLNNLQPNTNYEFKILSQCTSPDVSDYSSPTIPWTTLSWCNYSVPTNLVSSQITSTQVLLEWSWSGNISEYELSYKETGASDFTIISPVPNWRILTGLTPNTNYVWKVRPICAIGFGPSSTPLATFKTKEECKIPNDIEGVSNSLGTALISWSLINPNNNSYNYRYRKVGDPDWITGTQSTNALNLTGLEWGATYEFQIQTICDPNNLSVWSPLKTVIIKDNCTLNGPGGLTESVITSNGATLNWTAVNPNFGIIKYVLKIREESQGANEGLEYEIYAPTSSFTVNGLVTGVKYCWKLKSICSSGASDWGTSSCFTTIECAVPTMIKAVSNSLDGVTITWEPVPNAIAYNVDYSLSSNGPWTSVTTTTATAVITGLTSGTTYFYRVRTLCPNFNIGDWSNIGSFVTKDNCTLLAPIHPRNHNVQVTSAGCHWDYNEFGDSPIQSWDTWECFWNGMFCNLCIPCTIGFNIGPIAPPSGTVNYTIQYRIHEDGGGGAWTWEVMSNTYEVTLTNLKPCTRYNWRVRRNCTTGSSDWSSNDGFTTPCSFSDGDSGCTKIDAIIINNQESSISDAAAVTTISWFPRDPSVVKQYYTKLKEKDAKSGEYGTALNGSVESTRSSLELRNLKFDQDYRLEVIVECEDFDVYQSATFSEPSIIDFHTNPKRNIELKSSKFELKDVISIRPNPSKGIFEIGFASQEETNVSLRIFDVSGQTVIQEEFVAAIGSNNRTFNLEHISKGIYFVELNKGGKRTTAKMIISE